MRGACILLRSSCAYTLSRVAAALRAAGNEVVAHDHDDPCVTLIEAGGIDAVVTDRIDGRDCNIVNACNARNLPLLVTSEHYDSEAIELLCHGNIDHVIWGPDRANATATAIEKLLRESYLGLEKYISGYGVESYHLPLVDGASVRAAQQAVTDMLKSLAAPPPTLQAVAALARELADNALYTSPRDVDGRRRYTPADRQAGIRVADEERARFSYAFDGSRFYVAAMDGFGSLATTRVRSMMARNRRLASSRHPTHEPIATGLELAFHCASELIVNLVPRIATEVICGCDLHEEPRWRGIHFFASGERRIVETAEAPDSVHVSDSLLIDLRDRFARSPSHCD